MVSNLNDKALGQYLSHQSGGSNLEDLLLIILIADRVVVYPAARMQSKIAPRVR
jgi:hypothetical protein